MEEVTVVDVTLVVRDVTITMVAVITRHTVGKIMAAKDITALLVKQASSTTHAKDTDAKIIKNLMRHLQRWPQYIKQCGKIFFV